jgi:hypothetical protein
MEEEAEIFFGGVILTDFYYRSLVAHAAIRGVQR